MGFKHSIEDLDDRGDLLCEGQGSMYDPYDQRVCLVNPVICNCSLILSRLEIIAKGVDVRTPFFFELLANTEIDMSNNGRRLACLKG